MTTPSYDLVMVGSSFASTFFLKEYLSRAPASAKILVLERGHFFPHSERLKKERGGNTSFTNPNEIHTDTFVNETKKGWNFQPGFGGSSNCWHGCTPRFLPSDFRMKSLYGIAEDWPVQYDDLEPYYSEVEEIMAVSGSTTTPYPMGKPYPQPAHVFSTVDEILNREYGKLYINPPTARARIPVHGRGMCCASAVCSTCPVNAKFTIENGLKQVYEDPRVKLTYGAQVYGLDLIGNTARRIYFVSDGKEQEVSAEVFALGANAIFNPHILLNSGDNNSFTGKGLGEQVGLEAIVDLENLDCVGGSTKVNANGYMLYDGEHRKEFAACLMEAVNTPYIRFEKGKWRHQARFRMVFEDLPDKRNYVSTSYDQLKPKVHFNGISEYTKKGIENMKKVLPRLLSCLPVEKIEYSNILPTESHILGSTRMSTTASTGVIDKNLLHHQYRNLFVLGSGSFTTYTPSNPTLTLSALSVQAARNSF